MLLVSSGLWLGVVLLYLVDTAVASFVVTPNVRQRSKVHSTLALPMMTPKTDDVIVMAGDAASLCFFSVVQNIVDPYEAPLESLLGGDVVADYRLNVLANPLLASAVVVSCWLTAGAFSDAYATGSSLRTAQDSLINVLRTFVLYIPCVTLVLALLSGGLLGNDGVTTTAMIAAPDFTFCAGATSIVGSWRFTLAATIGK